MSQNKQTPANLPAVIQQRGEEIRSIAVPSIQKNYSMWLDRAINHLTTQDMLAQTLNTREGALSAFQALQKAAEIGLQVGGQYAHAHFMPKGGKITLVPTAEGLAFAATYGPGAVLASVPTIQEVREGDQVELDGAAQTIRHKYDPFDQERLKKPVTGYYAILEYKDGHTEIPFVTMADVTRIRDNYSQTKTSQGKPMPSWAKSEPEMLRKIAAKKILRKAAAESQGLAMLMNADMVPGEEQPEQPRDISERAASRLDKIETGVTDAEYSEEPESEKEKQTGSQFDDAGGLF